MCFYRQRMNNFHNLLSISPLYLYMKMRITSKLILIAMSSAYIDVNVYLRKCVSRRRIARARVYFLRNRDNGEIMHDYVKIPSLFLVYLLIIAQRADQRERAIIEKASFS